MGTNYYIFYHRVCQKSKSKSSRKSKRRYFRWQPGSICALGLYPFTTALSSNPSFGRVRNEAAGGGRGVGFNQRVFTPRHASSHMKSSSPTIKRPNNGIHAADLIITAKSFH